jgi:enoyl-[acyl-carrier protein] reductase I
MGFNKLLEYGEILSPLGNASAEDCADYVLTLFSDYTRKVTMQNLYHDGGFSSIVMTPELMEVFEKGTESEK